jgi:hypothetical protein
MIFENISLSVIPVFFVKFRCEGTVTLTNVVKCRIFNAVKGTYIDGQRIAVASSLNIESPIVTPMLCGPLDP